MAQCETKLRAWPGEDGVFQCRKNWGHALLDNSHVATGLQEYQRIEWFDGDRRQFTGEWMPCADLLSCTLPTGHPGDHV